MTSAFDLDRRRIELGLGFDRAGTRAIHAST
jgi:hypothetical protein